jgi:hypothetical protein
MGYFLLRSEMRKLALCGLIVAAYSGWPSVADAAYVIRLKNGNEFITGRYWQAGQQLFFDSYDGVFGIDRGFVLKIEKTEKAVRLATTAAHNPSEKSEAISKESGNDVTKETPAAETKAPAKKDENDPVYKEFDAVKAQSGELTTMLTDELNDYLKKVITLISKIQSERKVNQYLREYSELSAMANAAEAALKSRR